MKKKLAVVLIAALTVSTLAVGCGSSKDSSSTDTKETKTESTKDSVSNEGNTFTVGFDAEYPPYGYMDDDGEYTGFDLELAQAVCDLEGWTLVKKPINWDSKDMELNSGSIDCIWNGFTMNGREDDYTFSTPYVDNSQVIVVAENSGIEKLSDLAGKTVGVQAASAALDLLNSEEEGGRKHWQIHSVLLTSLLITIQHLQSFRQEHWMHLQLISVLQNIRLIPEETDIKSWMKL